MNLDDGRATAYGGVKLLIEQRVVIPIEIWCGIGGDARANRVLRSMLPSFGCVVFDEFIVKGIPGGGLAVEFRHEDLIGNAFHGFRELSESGRAWKGGVVVAPGRVRAGAMALGR